MPSPSYVVISSVGPVLPEFFVSPLWNTECVDCSVIKPLGCCLLSLQTWALLLPCTGKPVYIGAHKQWEVNPFAKHAKTGPCPGTDSSSSHTKLSGLICSWLIYWRGTALILLSPVPQDASITALHKLLNKCCRLTTLARSVSFLAWLGHSLVEISMSLPFWVQLEEICLAAWTDVTVWKVFITTGIMRNFERVPVSTHSDT